MASQHAKRFMLRNTIQTLPMRFANLPLPALKHHRFQRPISTSPHTCREYISVGPPDGWGYTLFDCDYDLEIANRISYEASVLVNGQLELLFPEDPKVVAEVLNEGLFHQLLERFLDRDWNDEVVYLGALAMRSGAAIGEEDMQVLREFVGYVKMYDQAREQMRAALKGYNTAGGYPWGFSCLGLLEEQVQGDVKGENLDNNGILAKNLEKVLFEDSNVDSKEWEGNINADDAGAGEPNCKEATA